MSFPQRSRAGGRADVRLPSGVGLRPPRPGRARWGPTRVGRRRHPGRSRGRPGRLPPVHCGRPVSPPWPRRLAPPPPPPPRREPCCLCSSFVDSPTGPPREPGLWAARRVGSGTRQSGPRRPVLPPPPPASTPPPPFPSVAGSGHRPGEPGPHPGRVLPSAARQ